MTRALPTAAVVLSSLSFVDCGAELAPASLSASVAVASTDRVCAGEGPGSVCRVTKAFTVSLKESTGQDVALHSISGVLLDTRGMHDMHAAPPELLAEDVRLAAGSSSVPGRGELDVPYTLEFEFVQPAIIGPLKVIVRARGRDSSGHDVEASAEGL